MNKLLFCGALLGLISVVMGAAGDHLITLTPETAHSLETAIRYNMLYAVLVVVLSLVTPHRKYISRCGWIFAVGVAIFSGSIYLSLFFDVPEITYLTPLGGVSLMLGWTGLILVAIRRSL